MGGAGVLRCKTQRAWLVFHILALTSLQLLNCQPVSLPPEPDTTCLVPGSNAGRPVPQERCSSATPYDWDEDIAGLLPNEECVICGSYEYSWPPSKLQCPATTSSLTYAAGEWRYCACNKGYYGNQIAGSCRKCPSGTTTMGVGASLINHCNVCDVGFTGSPSSKCVSCSTKFEGKITTAGPGNNLPCVCPQGYIGKPGNCTKCPGTSTTAEPGAQTCLCPAGGKMPDCKPCTGGQLVDGECVCPVGKTGTWPDCESCPTSLGYKQTTFAPGNKQRCMCSLFHPLGEDSLQTQVVDRDPGTGACTCRETNGHFLKVVPNYFWDTEMGDGPCETFWDEEEQARTQLVVMGGRQRLGCNVSAGWAVNVASQIVFNSDYCIKCEGPGVILDHATSRCMCGPGYGVNPNYGGDSGGQAYCIPCAGPAQILGTIRDPRYNSDQVYCMCNTAAGYEPSGKEGQCVLPLGR